MLIDGAAVGLGQLHRLLSFAQYPPLRVWELAHRLYIASWDGGWMNKFVPKPNADPEKLVGRSLVLRD